MALNGVWLSSAWSSSLEHRLSTSYPAVELFVFNMNSARTDQSFGGLEDDGSRVIDPVGTLAGSVGKTMATMDGRGEICLRRE